MGNCLSSKNKVKEVGKNSALQITNNDPLSNETKEDKEEKLAELKRAYTSLQEALDEDDDKRDSLDLDDAEFDAVVPGAVEENFPQIMPKSCFFVKNRAEIMFFR